MGSRDAELTADVCLALVGEAPTHGWALVRILSPTGELGQIWSVSRPLVYRAIDGLVAQRLVVRAKVVPGQGPERAVVKATARGRRVATQWLDEPVGHLRDVRTALLLKLVLRTRRGLSNDALLLAQRQHFAAAIATLTRRRSSDDVVDVWRRQSALAVGRFLDEALRRERRATSSSAPHPDLRSGVRRRTAVAGG